MRVLVIDDEIQIRRLLEIAIASKGWEAFSSATGEDGLDAARALKPDVVLLDLNLPDLPGKAVLERLRSWSGVPVVIVSVRDSEADIVSLLENGADDYVVKPFHTGILLARLLSVHRRRSPEAVEVFRTGRVRFDLGSRDLEVDGQQVKLTPTEYAVLAALARAAGKIVMRDRLLREVWGPETRDDGSLRVYVSSLRKKLERDPASPELILNEPGIGYRLCNPDDLPA